MQLRDNVDEKSMWFWNGVMKRRICKQVVFLRHSPSRRWIRKTAITITLITVVTFSICSDCSSESDSSESDAVVPYSLLD